MAAVLFIVTVPKAEFEQELKRSREASSSPPSDRKVTSVDIESEISIISKSEVNLTCSSKGKSSLEKKFYSNSSTQISPIKKSHLNESCIGNSTENTDGNIESICNTTINAPKIFTKSKSEAVLKTKFGKVFEKSVGGTETCHSLRKSFERLNYSDSAAGGSRSNTLLEHKTIDGDDVPMEKILSDVLSRLRITDAVWSGEGSQGRHLQASFGVRGAAQCEKALLALRNAGLGSKPATTLGVLPCALHYRPPDPPKRVKTRHHKRRGEDIKDSAWSNFVRSVRSRQTVAQVAEQVRAGAALTFDFFFLLMVAALTAAIGLVENSTVFLVASMLISPLMGPIMAGTFGTAIRDRDLQKMGVIHELIGLFMALVVGFLFGLIICTIDEHYGDGEWPTYEITSRCDLRSLWIGALVAVPSGAAVAIAVLADNTASLVGVAISASLLPPAVNAGLLWAMASIHLFFINDDTRFTNIVKTKDYSENPVIELAVNASISLCLTLVNIICIYFAGILVYMIKEVAPVNSKDDQFWKHDIKAARDFNKTIHGEAKAQTPTKAAGKSIATNNSSFEEAMEHAAAWATFRYNLDQRDVVDRFRLGSGYHMTWSPAASFNRRPSAHELHGRYQRLNEDPSLRRPRLSFPINHLPGYSKLEEEMITTHPDNDFSGHPKIGRSSTKAKIRVKSIENIHFDV